MVNRLKNKKIVFSLAALAVVSVIGGTILLSSSKSSEKSLDESNREQVSKVQEASILGVDEATDSQEEVTEEEETTEVPAIEASEAINTTTNSNNTSSTTTHTTPSCTPTLQAIIVRPYEYNYHLGDQADKISGSYGGTCITAEEVSYEWFIYGGTYNVAYTRFSTSVKPDFSGYQSGTYDVDLNVSARGLNSKIKTWVHVTVPSSNPPASFPKTVL